MKFAIPGLHRQHVSLFILFLLWSFLSVVPRKEETYGLEELSRLGDSRIERFHNHFYSTCKRKFNAQHFIRNAEWDQNKICTQSWFDVDSFGIFSPNDFKLKQPNSVMSGKIRIGNDSDFLDIPHSLCLFQTSGYFVANTGLLFDCSSQYPLLMPRRKDLTHVLTERTAPPQPQEVVFIPSNCVFSLVLPYNDQFGHAFTTGVSHLAHLLPLLIRYNDSIVIYPKDGPMGEILRALELPASRFLAVGGASLVWAPKASLLLRKAPFNIVTAHWVGRSAEGLRLRLRSRLMRKLGISMPSTVPTLNINGSSNGSILSPPIGKYVVFLWRPPGARYLANTDEVLRSIENSLVGTPYALRVFGKDSKVASNSRDSWLGSAEIFLQAAAVIGMHGSAWGNAFLCPTDAVLIEFNLPWTAAQQKDSDLTPPAVRDAIMATMHNAGLQNYYNVFPLSRGKSIPHKGFYFDNAVSVNTKDILIIMNHHHMLTREKNN